jgi:hypothetical protein
MPTRTAKSFVGALNNQDYAAAETLTWHNDDLAFIKWKDDRWGLAIDAELAPWSIRQLLIGRRDVNMRMKYFQLDQNFDIQMQLAATPFGLKKPDTINTINGAVVERINDVSNIR